MHRNGSIGSAAIALLICAIGCSKDAAKKPNAGSTQRALDQTSRVTVVVQMSLEPVAELRARAPDRAITQAQHDAVRSQIAEQHATLEPEITARGGRVLARFHDALNGVKVEIDRNQIAGLQSAAGVISVLPVGKHHVL